MSIQITHADVMEGLKEIPDNSIDCVITSPPYNIGIDYGEYKDNRPWDEYYSWCEQWIKEIYRVLKADGRFCLNHYLSLGDANGRFTPLMTLNETCTRIGFHHHACAVWLDPTRVKYTAWGSWMSASAPYINSPTEGILILYKENWKKEERGKSTVTKEEFIEGVSGVWKLGTARVEGHPAPFPEKFARICINLLTYEGDTVLDPFAGSGTVGKVATALNRNAIMIELNGEYVALIKDRLRTREKLEV